MDKSKASTGIDLAKGKHYLATAATQKTVVFLH